MKAPHVVPYQGSKRKIAEEILKNIPYKIQGRLLNLFPVQQR